MNSGPLTYRKIVPKLVAQGYGVIVPEMLGYGGTDKPTDVIYFPLMVAESFAKILAFENVKSAIVLGHDFVSEVTSNAPRRTTKEIFDSGLGLSCGHSIRSEISRSDEGVDPVSTTD